MTEQILADAIRDMLDKGDLESVRIFIESEHPADVAHFLDTLEPAESWRLIQLLKLPDQAEIFGYLDLEHQVAVSALAGRRHLARIISEMDSDERVDLFNELPEEQREALLPALAQAEREDIRRLASYEEGTAGAIMSSDYATLTPDLTVRQAIEKLRREAPDKETIYVAYVIDDKRRLVGTVSLRELIVTPDHVRVSEIMEDDPVSGHVDEEQEEIVRKIAKYDLMALPILNGGDALVGIVTYDDAMDVAEAEATEDIHRVGSVGPIDASVRDASIRTLFSKRAPWLILLVFANIFSGAGIAYFEDTIAAYVALVFFLPLLIDSGGNAGSQSATLMVRAMATGDVAMKDWSKMLGREFLVAGALGLTMAVAVSGIGVFRGGPDIALVVALSMVVIVIVGSVIGMSLPFILSRFKLDPATASAPLVTSICDATGVIIYFTIAATILVLPAVG
jgi:magnesium transporter